MSRVSKRVLENLGRAAECLRVLAHPHRLLIAKSVMEGELTVGELAEVCGIPSHMASEHLKLLERCGLMRCERRGRNKFYKVAEPHLEEILRCVERRFLT